MGKTNKGKRAKRKCFFMVLPEQKREKETNEKGLVADTRWLENLSTNLLCHQ